MPLARACPLTPARAGLRGLQQQLLEMRRLLENYHILPPTVAAALIVEHGRATGDERVPREREQVELLTWLLDTPEIGQQPVASSGGGVRLRPPKLDPPPGAHPEEPFPPDEPEKLPDALREEEEQQEEDEPELPIIVATRWGGVRVAPPRLSAPLLESPDDQEEPPTEPPAKPPPAELALEPPPAETVQALLSMVDPPLEEQPVIQQGGGVRVIPHRLLPFLPPPSPEALAPEVDEALAPIEEAPIDPVEDGVVVLGGGARLPPPKLRPVALPAPALEVIEAIEDQHAAAGEEGPRGSGFTGNRELFLSAMQEGIDPLDVPPDAPIEEAALHPGVNGGYGIKYVCRSRRRDLWATPLLPLCLRPLAPPLPASLRCSC